MPTDPAGVGVDDLLDVLARLGCPTVFLHADLAEPDPDAIPQLIGVLAAAVDRVALAHTVPTDLARMRSWAAGFLQTQGAGTPCGDRTAFDLLTVRLQMFEVLLEGYRTGGPLGQLLRALLGAASCFAVASATATAVRAGVLAADDVRELSDRQVAEGRALITAAVALEQQLREALDAAARGGTGR